MIVRLIHPGNRSYNEDPLKSYFRLRRDTFVGRLSWALETAKDGMERDQFDTPAATYLTISNPAGDVIAGARFLRTDHPNLLADVFPFLCKNAPPRSPRIWEVTRLVIDNRKDRLAGCDNVSGLLFCGLLEFGLLMGASHLVSVSDTRIERILRLAGWTADRLGEVHSLGKINAVAKIQPLSRQVLATCRTRMKVIDEVLPPIETILEAA
ncbi:MAG: autoinducer synthase [Rhodospirillales bacterium]|nr:autoinducer synthase [Rhodospirillales bacterium]